MRYTWNNPVFIADTNSLRLRNYLHSIKLVLTYLEIISFIWWVPSQVWKNQNIECGKDWYIPKVISYISIFVIELKTIFPKNFVILHCRIVRSKEYQSTAGIQGRCRIVRSKEYQSTVGFQGRCRIVRSKEYQSTAGFQGRCRIVRSKEYQSTAGIQGRCRINRQK